MGVGQSSHGSHHHSVFRRGLPRAPLYARSLLLQTCRRVSSQRLQALPRPCSKPAGAVTNKDDGLSTATNKQVHLGGQGRKLLTEAVNRFVA